MRIYDSVEATTIDADDFTVHGIHLGPQPMTTVAVLPGANVYPVPLKANVAGRLVATCETFANAAWKSFASVIVPAKTTQRAVLANVLKSELQSTNPASNTYGFTADLQPVANTNTQAATSDAVPFSIQLAVANCAQACNVFVTLA